MIFIVTLQILDQYQKMSPIRTLSVRMVAPSDKYTNNNIVVNLPNVENQYPFYCYEGFGVFI